MSSFGPSPAQPVPPPVDQTHRVAATDDRRQKRHREDEPKKQETKDSVEITGPKAEAEGKPAAPRHDEGDQRAHIDVQG